MPRPSKQQHVARKTFEAACLDIRDGVDDDGEEDDARGMDEDLLPHALADAVRVVKHLRIRGIGYAGSDAHTGDPILLASVEQ